MEHSVDMCCRCRLPLPLPMEEMILMKIYFEEKMMMTSRRPCLPLSPCAFRGARIGFFFDAAVLPEWDELLLLGIFHGVTTNPTLLEAGRACVLAPWTSIHELATIALQKLFRRKTNSCTLAGAEKNEGQWTEWSRGVSAASLRDTFVQVRNG
jgi:hypothetical protein